MISGHLLIDGQWRAASKTAIVSNKFTGSVISEISQASEQDVNDAVAAARQAFSGKELSPYRRYEILLEAARHLRARRDEAIDLMIAETGFTRNDCSGEFARCIETLTLSAEEAKRINGEMVPIHGAPGQAAEKLAFTIRMPIGVVCAITPFNAPLNTVAHKIAPALAAGNSVVLKPASYTPLSAALLCECIIEAGLPAGWLNLVHGTGKQAGNWLLANQSIDYFTFTGSTGVGQQVQQGAGLRRTQLELGNISATIVFADAELEVPVQKCIGAGFRKAGQVCTSVQRILVHESVIDRFASILTEKTNALIVGNPQSTDTFVGPMIDAVEAERAQNWIEEAVANGATCLAGGQREAAILQPTILKNAGPDMKVVSEEIFAPVVSLIPFTTDESAFQIANDTPFGLSVGLFTGNLNRALKAIRELRMGSIHVNETSSNRVDLMPYGGLKQSGFGHEGPRYAIQDMTEERLVTLNTI
jgi:acyl-CoA reductase-like NAD-dependent aldehyde dehydrogenase